MLSEKFKEFFKVTMLDYLKGSPFARRTAENAKEESPVDWVYDALSNDQHTPEHPLAIVTAQVLRDNEKEAREIIAAVMKEIAATPKKEYPGLSEDTITGLDFAIRKGMQMPFFALMAKSMGPETIYENLTDPKNDGIFGDHPAVQELTKSLRENRKSSISLIRDILADV